MIKVNVLLFVLIGVWSATCLADNISSSNVLFDFAEVNYPQYFRPADQSTFELEGYIVRYFSETNSYLGTSGNDVYVYGPAFFGPGVVRVGTLTDFVAESSSDFLPVVSGRVGSSSTNMITPTLARTANLSKGLTVFGINILATADTPNSKILHAANVMAELIDNNENGLPDNQTVLDKLVSLSSHLIMHNQQEINGEGEDNGGIDENENKSVEINYDVLQRVTTASQALGAFETRINYADGESHDASIEEIFHLITQFGYSNVYPEVLGESNTSTSTLAQAMDVARGGRVTNMPPGGWVYPASAWYFYSDPTADYATMMTEYIYWAVTSNIGMHDSPAGLARTSSEWLPNTKEKLRIQDPTIYELVNNTQYAFPLILPDANYSKYQFSEADIITF